MNINASQLHGFSVNTKLSSFIFVAIAVIIVLQAILNLHYAQQRNEVYEQELLTAVYNGFSSEVEMLKRTASALSEDFAKRAEVVHYIDSNDRGRLLASLYPIYDTLKTDYVNPLISVFDADGAVLLRVEQPNLYGDAQIDNNAILKAAIQSGQAASGISLRRYRLSVHSIAPIFRANTLIGLIEIDLAYNMGFLERLKALNGVDYTLWLTRTAVSRVGRWTESSRLPVSTSSQLIYYLGTYFSSLPISEATYNTVLETGIPQTEYLSVMMTDDSVLPVKQKSEALAVWIAPFQDFNGQNMGVLEIVRSRTTVLTALYTEQNRIVLVACISLVLVMGVVWGVTNAVVTRPLKHLTKVTQRHLQGDLNARVNLVQHDEFGLLGSTFNHMTDELRGLIGSLEQRVQDRTHDLNTAAEVSNQLTRVLDLDELLPSLTELTCDRFGVSYVSVFLYQSSDQTVRLVAASGEVGAIMLQRNVRLRFESNGLVSRAARTHKPVIINDVTMSDEFLPSPLLPYTRSEAALPMTIGSALIGVLDLQSDKLGHFTPEYVNVLMTLAEQISIAVRNAQLFEEVKIAREQAEQASRIKSSFLAHMSHELRTPLNAVLNFSQFLSSGLLGSVNAEQVEMLNKITLSGRHLLDLINDVLDISKIESGALQLYIEDDVDLKHEVQLVTDTGRALLNTKPVNIRAEVAPDVPRIAADKGRVRQILLNLVANACKFTESGEIIISLYRQDQEMFVSVRDTGSGIAHDEFDTIFEAFRQTSSGLRQGSGTGLGLAISRKLAEAHGGRLWVESEVGSGSTFFIVFPVHPSILTRTKDAHNGSALI